MKDDKPLPQRPTRQHESLQVQPTHQHVDSLAQCPQDIFSCNQEKMIGKLLLVHNFIFGLSCKHSGRARQAEFQCIHSLTLKHLFNPNKAKKEKQ